MPSHLHLDIKCKQRKSPPVCPEQRALNGAARSNIIQMSLALSPFLHIVLVFSSFFGLLMLCAWSLSGGGVEVNENEVELVNK